MITFDKGFLCHLVHCGLFDSFPDDVGRIIHIFISRCTGYHQCCSITDPPKPGSWKPQPSHCLWSYASGTGQDLEEMVHLCSHGIDWVAQFSSTWPLSCPGTLTIQGSSLSFQHGGWLQRGGKLGSLLMSGLRGSMSPFLSHPVGLSSHWTVWIQEREIDSTSWWEGLHTDMGWCPVYTHQRWYPSCRQFTMVFFCNFATLITIIYYACLSSLRAYVFPSQWQHHGVFIRVASEHSIQNDMLNICWVNKCMRKRMNLDFYLNLTTITRREYSLKKRKQPQSHIWDFENVRFSFLCKILIFSTCTSLSAIMCSALGHYKLENSSFKRILWKTKMYLTQNAHKRSLTGDCMGIRTLGKWYSRVEKRRSEIGICVWEGKLKFQKSGQFLKQSKVEQ